MAERTAQHPIYHDRPAARRLSRSRRSSRPQYAQSRLPGTLRHALSTRLFRDAQLHSRPTHGHVRAGARDARHGRHDRRRGLAAGRDARRRAVRRRLSVRDDRQAAPLAPPQAVRLPPHACSLTARAARTTTTSTGSAAPCPSSAGRWPTVSPPMAGKPVPTTCRKSRRTPSGASPRPSSSYPSATPRCPTSSTYRSLIPHPPFTPPQFYYDRYAGRDLGQPAIGDWAPQFSEPQKGFDPEGWMPRRQQLRLDDDTMHYCRCRLLRSHQPRGHADRSPVDVPAGRKAARGNLHPVHLGPR